MKSIFSYHSLIVSFPSSIANEVITEEEAPTPTLATNGRDNYKMLMSVQQMQSMHQQHPSQQKNLQQHHYGLGMFILGGKWFGNLRISTQFLFVRKAAIAFSRQPVGQAGHGFPKGSYRLCL
jgi:hypothetical protein